MYKSYVVYLQHILDECLYVRSVITDEMQMEHFLCDETLKRAVTRSLSIIGYSRLLIRIKMIYDRAMSTYHLGFVPIRAIRVRKIPVLSVLSV